MAAETRKVAIAVDASEYAEYAFTWYVHYMHHPENEVICVHIPDGFDINKAQKEIAKGGAMKEQTERIYSKITELEERYHHMLHHHKLRGTVLSVPSKAPGQTILETANEEGCFVIVMGTRGRSMIQKAIMGSVSDYVLKNANIPVIIVRKIKDKDDK